MKAKKQLNQMIRDQRKEKAKPILQKFQLMKLFITQWFIVENII